ncbi:MAG: hypothetical protein AB203_01130 [Parcubacteria bacterium C7867-008]|nr:MAG: hypothetical protein AB203_01130 [Parcubacteria bacterium C7867-008]
MKTKLQTKRGFTLIELLVVIAIVSLVSSLTYANIASARTKGLDSRKKADLSSVRTAIQSYTLDKGRPPHNYDCSGGCVVNDSRTTLAIEDAPGTAPTESGKAYNASMQELVAGKYLPAVPRSPGGAGYAYYNYGAGTAAGAIIGTSLDAEKSSATGSTGTCRPFPGGSGGDSGGGEIGGGGGGLLDVFDLGGGAGPGGVGVWLNCTYVDAGGLTYEAPCPPGFDGDTPTLCSASDSKDFCFCSPY